jgi:hypothetical protein
MKKAIERTPRFDPIVNKILTDIDYQMDQSTDDKIIVECREFPKKYKLSSVELYNTIRNNVLNKIRTHGYSVTMDVHDSLHITW